MITNCAQLDFQMAFDNILNIYNSVVIVLSNGLHKTELARVFKHNFSLNIFFVIILINEKIMYYLCKYNPYSYS